MGGLYELGYSGICVMCVIVSSLVDISQQLGYGSVTGSSPTFRGLFNRLSNKRLSAIHERVIKNSTVEECAEACVKETQFLCISFDFDNDARACLLFNVNADSPDVIYMDSAGRDHYETAYLRQFNKLTQHRLYTWVNKRIAGISEEECARRCVLETYFACRGFNYKQEYRSCSMTESTAANSNGVLLDDDVDYYQRSPDGPLAKFLSYGHQAMRRLQGGEVYSKSVMGIGVEECASRCIESTQFDCLSFDYVHEGERSTCHMSQYIAANVYGLENPDMDLRVNHYERIESELANFYATPYSVILGNNEKTYKWVTPNRCARMCMEESGFVCRSFDYQVFEGTCALSSKTGSDVGGLYSEGTNQVHHFEMKPILDCGVAFNESSGHFASPGWPRDYSHHEQCTWSINVPKNKVIRIEFTHFELALQSDDPCEEGNDRLVVTESGKSECVQSNTHNIITKTNHVELNFFTNGVLDGQGFRAFYNSEWTCNALLTETMGEIASPNYPDRYPSARRCSWRISAPRGQRVKLSFTAFELEKGPLGHCNENFDHVKILDGGTTKAPLIGLYCGFMKELVVRSSGQDMFVQFRSDTDHTNPGFHAYYVFEGVNGTVELDGKGPGASVDEEDEEDKEEAEEVVSTAQPQIEDNNIDDSVILDVETGEAGSKLLHGDTRVAASSEVTHNDYKTAMWAIVTILTLALIAVSVVLFLVWRHYRRILRYMEERVEHEDELGVDPEHQPLHPSQCQPISILTRPPYIPKQNNYTSVRLHGNEVHLQTNPDDTANGACAPATSCDTPNGAYGKYASDNAKNINLETCKKDNGYRVDLPEEEVDDLKKFNNAL